MLTLLKDRVIKGCFVTKDRVIKARFVIKDRVIKTCFMIKDRVIKTCLKASIFPKLGAFKFARYNRLVEFYLCSLSI